MDFLKKKSQELDWFQFNAWLEDDHLSQAFLDAKDQGQDPTQCLDMALKSECDSGPGHVCYFGPKGVDFLRSILGLDCCICTLGDLSTAEMLPKPLAMVHDDQHWVPMWHPSMAGPS